MILRFGVLSPLEVWSERVIVPFRGAKRRALLPYLLA